MPEGSDSFIGIITQLPVVALFLWFVIKTQADTRKYLDTARKEGNRCVENIASGFSERIAECNVIQREGLTAMQNNTEALARLKEAVYVMQSTIEDGGEKK